jgi:glutathione S-transferase
MRGSASRNVSGASTIENIALANIARARMMTTNPWIRNMPVKLIIGNKAYSSWSLRPWILLAGFHVPFEEVVVRLYEEDTRKRVLKYSPTGKLPALIDGDITVWDSLAIIDYVAETNPKKAIWPRDKAARAHARSLRAEMHAGFTALRNHCPTNFRRAPKKRDLTPDVVADVARIEKAWAHARKTFGANGPYLFGEFSAADAMFAPVVNRFQVYEIPVGRATRAYMKTMLDHPAYRAWLDDAAKEPWRNEAYEV